MPMMPRCLNGFLAQVLQTSSTRSIFNQVMVHKVETSPYYIQRNAYPFISLERPKQVSFFYQICNLGTLSLHSKDLGASSTETNNIGCQANASLKLKRRPSHTHTRVQEAFEYYTG